MMLLLGVRAEGLLRAKPNAYACKDLARKTSPFNYGLQGFGRHDVGDRPHPSQGHSSCLGILGD